MGGGVVADIEDNLAVANMLAPSRRAALYKKAQVPRTNKVLSTTVPGIPATRCAP